MKIQETKIVKIEANEQEVKVILGALLYTVHRMEKHNNPVHLIKNAGIKITEIKEVIEAIQKI